MKKDNFKTNLRVGFGFSLVVLLASSVASYVSVTDLIKNSEWVNHTNEVNIKLGQILLSLVDGETAMRGYGLTGDKEFLQPYERMTSRVRQLTDSVALLTSDNGLQRRYFQELIPLVDTEMKILRNNIERKTHSGKISNDSLELGKMYMDKIRNHLAGMQEVETQLLARRSEGVNKLTSFTMGFIVAAFLLSMIVTSYYYFKIRFNVAEMDLIRSELDKKKLETARQIEIIKNHAGEIAAGNYSKRIGEDILKK